MLKEYSLPKFMPFTSLCVNLLHCNSVGSMFLSARSVEIGWIKFAGDGGLTCKSQINRIFVFG